MRSTASACAGSKRGGEGRGRVNLEKVVILEGRVDRHGNGPGVDAAEERDDEVEARLKYKQDLAAGNRTPRHRWGLLEGESDTTSFSLEIGVGEGTGDVATLVDPRERGRRRSD